MPKPLVPHCLQDEKEVGIYTHSFLSTCLDVVTPPLGDGAKGEVHLRARAGEWAFCGVISGTSHVRIVAWSWGALFLGPNQFI